MTMSMTPSSGSPPSPDADLDGLLSLVASGRSRSTEDEFAAFMAEHAGALGRTAWLLCGDRHQAEELTQLALTRTYLAWSRARQRDPLAFARRTLANARIDTWRRRRREVLTDPADIPPGTHGDSSGDVADRDRLLRALATLSRRQRRVVVLRHIEDLSEREVAEALGISTGTVKSTASRALATLRHALDDETSGTGGAPSPQTRGTTR